jgi:carbonyl reductase 1
MTTALVTGATQNLGLALVHGLKDRFDDVYLTGRDPERVAALAKDLGVHGRVVDVTSDESVQAAAGALGAVDAVFSNACARVTPERTPAEQVDLFVETNNRGTMRMLRSFGPILRPGGRLIVVASAFGTLRHLDERLRPLFASAATLDAVDAVVEGWRRAVHDGTAVAQGWPEWLNVPSKVAQVAAVRAVAAERRERDLAAGTLVAAVCPGLIDTPASRPWFADMSAAQTPAQAAARVLEFVLATPPDPATYGELVQFGKVLPWT